MPERIYPTEFFPSDSAIKLGHSAGLCELPARHNYEHVFAYPAFPGNWKQDRSELLAECDRIKLFQQMSIASTFDMAITAAWPIKSERDKLTETQITILEVIYEMTRNWSVGYVAEKLIEAIETDRTSSKPALADALIAIMNGQSPNEVATGKAAGTIKQFFMELTTDS